MSNLDSNRSRALPIARFFLQLLIVLNWMMGAGIFGMLIISIANAPWFMSALKVSAATEPNRVLMGMRAIMVLGLVGIPLHYLVLKRLLAIVQTVNGGDPFVATNAHRLKAIAWVLLSLNLLSIVIGAIAGAVSTKTYPLHLNAGFSINGWLAVLLTFVLARVFEAGSGMREDLEGTI